MKNSGLKNTRVGEVFEGYAVQRILKYDKLPNSSWTKFNNLLQRFLYDRQNEIGENGN